MAGEYRAGNAIKLIGSGDIGRAILEGTAGFTLYPFSRWTQEALAVTRLTGAMHPDIALEAINIAMADDPYSPNLLWHRIVQKLRLGKYPRKDIELWELIMRESSVRVMANQLPLAPLE